MSALGVLWSGRVCCLSFTYSSSRHEGFADIFFINRINNGIALIPIMVYSAKVQKNGIAFVSFEFGFMDASYRGQALRT